MRHTSRARAVALGAVAGVSLTGCAWNGWGGTAGGEGSDSITVLMVNNPQMIDLQQLTDEHFTAETGIEVSYTVLPENDVRDKIGQEFSSQAGQYDVASLSNFEIPIYAGAGWVEPLDDYIAADADFDQADILPPMQTSLSYNDQVYGQPFYGESSFLMYRKDVLEAQGLTMPESPTWPEVAELAEQLDGAEPGMAGICLRGQPGWGQVIAPLTTVVNTFGGTWFDAGLVGGGRRAGVHRGHQLLRRPGARVRAQRRSPGRLHRMPEQPHPGHRRHVVRLHRGRRHPGGRRLAGAGSRSATHRLRS